MFILPGRSADIRISLDNPVPKSHAAEAYDRVTSRRRRQSREYQLQVEAHQRRVVRNWHRVFHKFYRISYWKHLTEVLHAHTAQYGKLGWKRWGTYGEITLDVSVNITGYRGIGKIVRLLDFG